MRSKFIYPFSFSCLFILISILFFNASNNCTYRIKGQLQVKSQFPELEDNIYPLEGVKIKVSGKSCSGCWYKSWGETTTASDGSFQVNESKSGNACNGRHIRAQAKFKSSRLKIRNGGLMDSLGSPVGWYDIGKRTDNQCGQARQTQPKTGIP